VDNNGLFGCQPLGSVHTTPGSPNFYIKRFLGSNRETFSLNKSEETFSYACFVVGKAISESEDYIINF
jgi:hypothetical protein